MFIILHVTKITIINYIIIINNAHMSLIHFVGVRQIFYETIRNIIIN